MISKLPGIERLIDVKANSCEGKIKETGLILLWFE
jgi:hypothetical protein